MKRKLDKRKGRGKEPEKKITFAAYQAEKEAGVPFYLLDIREPEAYRAFHLEGAVNIPMGKIGDHLQTFPKNKKILVICEKGIRAEQITKILTLLGYQAVTLTGGMQNGLS